MRWGQVEYARSGDAHVAYRTVVGNPNSEHLVVMVNGYLYPMDVFGEDPVASRLVEGLASLGTLVMFDRRGIGLSDGLGDRDTNVVDQWADDLLAVLDATGRRTATIFSWHGFGTGRRFAARYPDRVDRLILFNPFTNPREQDREWILGVRDRVGQMLAGAADGSAALPNRRDDPVFRDWQDRAGRFGASPSQAARIHESETGSPVESGAGVVAPTLVIARATPDFGVPREFLERAADEIPDATLATLPDGDAFPIGAGVDAILAEVSRYLTGTVSLPAPEREIRAILFTDLVDSTRCATSVGDARWRSVLDRHDSVCRSAASRVNGEIVKSTGDGVLATFPSVGAAIGAARDIRTRLAGDGLAVRAAVHVGEVDRRGGDISGVAINIAARAMAAASGDEILLTEVAVTVGQIEHRDAVGTTMFKGSDETWALFRVS